MAFENLPGVLVNTVDGGLAARRAPRTKSTLLLGTAAKGPVNGPFQVVDRAAAAAAFGFEGTLIRTMEEASQSDNLFLFRVGTKAAVLEFVGKEYLAAVSISNVERTANVVTITTSAPHNLVAGDEVQVDAVTNTSVNGEFLVLSAPTGTTFTYAQTGADIPSVVDTGTIQEVITQGFSLSLGARVADAGTRYKIWYSAGILYLWLDGNLVFANDVGANVVVDTGDTTVTGSSSGGEDLGDQGALAKTLAGAITLEDAAAIVPGANNAQPQFIVAVTGIGLNARQLYVGLEKALDLLQIFEVQQVVVGGVSIDNPNVAFHVPADLTTVENNPVTNTEALDWLKTTKNVDGTRTYHWASESVDSEGGAVTPPTFSDSQDRLDQGYHEVNFAYQLARFCALQGNLQAGCVGFIGARKPAKFDLATIREWVGALPTKDSDGVVTAPGRGLLGIAYLTGTTTAKLHALAFDKSNTHREPGFFENLASEYDGGRSLDRNNNPIDIGAYLHVIGEWSQISNGFGTYVGNLAGVVAGMVSAMDEKSSPTNKPVVSVRQLHKLSFAQLDALTFAKINVLRFKAPLQSPVLLHGRTASTDASDYINLLRQRIKFLVVKVLREEADKFIGESTIDGLQLQAMRTALDARLIELQRRGYLSQFNYVISATAAEQRIGHANIDITFVPADELVRLNATVGIARR